MKNTQDLVAESSPNKRILGKEWGKEAVIISRKPPSRKRTQGTSLVVQWLRLHASNEGDVFQSLLG